MSEPGRTCACCKATTHQTDITAKGADADNEGKVRTPACHRASAPPEHQRDRVPLYHQFGPKVVFCGVKVGALIIQATEPDRRGLPLLISRSSSNIGIGGDEMTIQRGCSGRERKSPGVCWHALQSRSKIAVKKHYSHRRRRRTVWTVRPMA